MEISEVIYLFLITYDKDSKNFMKTLEKRIKEEIDMSHLFLKKKSSFNRYSESDYLSIYFIYISDRETFIRFSKEFSADSKQFSLQFIVICSDIPHELMILSYKYKIRALGFIDSSISTCTYKQEIKEYIDYVRTIQTYLKKKEGNIL